MIQEEQIRFSGFDWFPKQQKKISITIGGAGGIGSWTAFLLSRIGYEIFLYDFDKVEKHNLSGQLFSKDSINRYKSYVVEDLIRNYSNSVITAFNEHITSSTQIYTPYVISAFDNMEARTDLFSAFLRWCDNQPNYISQIANQHGFVDERLYALSETPLFIDGRLEAEQLQIFCVTPENANRYQETLFGDSEVADAPCTFKQTSHNANLIASLIVSLFTNHITNLVLGEEIREVPFKTEFSIPFLHLEKTV